MRLASRETFRSVQELLSVSAAYRSAEKGRYKQFSSVSTRLGPETLKTWNFCNYTIICILLFVLYFTWYIYNSNPDKWCDKRAQIVVLPLLDFGKNGDCYCANTTFISHSFIVLEKCNFRIDLLSAMISFYITKQSTKYSRRLRRVKITRLESRKWHQLCQKCINCYVYL